MTTNPAPTEAPNAKGGMEVPSLPGQHIATSLATTDGISRILRRAGWNTTRTGTRHPSGLRLHGQSARWSRDGAPIRFVSRSDLFGATGDADDDLVTHFARKSETPARECQAILIESGYLCTPVVAKLDPAGRIEGYEFHIARYTHPSKRRVQMSVPAHTSDPAPEVVSAACQLLIAAAAGDRPADASRTWDALVEEHGRAAAWAALVAAVQQAYGLAYQAAVAHAHKVIEDMAAWRRASASPRLVLASEVRRLMDDLSADLRMTVDAVTFFRGDRDRLEMLALVFDPDPSEYQVVHAVVDSDLRTSLTYRSSDDARDGFAEQAQKRIYR